MGKTTQFLASRSSGGDYLGLFGALADGAVISAVGLDEVCIIRTIGTGGFAGGLVAWNSGLVSGSYVRGSVHGRGTVGGLVGNNFRGTISTCYSTCGVIGKSSSGGLAGANSGSIFASHSEGSVSDKDQGVGTAGGLVGTNYGGIWASYSTSSVYGTSSVGGLAGTNVGAIWTSYSTGSVGGAAWGARTGEFGGLVGWNSGSISASYTTGVVTGDDNYGGLYVGGLVGHNPYGTVSGSFWDRTTSGRSSSRGGTGLTTAEMQTTSIFLQAGWDFVDETRNGPNDVWKIVEGQTYPLLSWQKYGGGTGEPNDPYLIYTAEHLNALGAEPNDHDKHFKLMAEIDLSGYTYDGAVITSFTGVLDGNGHVISHLTAFGRRRALGLFERLGRGG